MLKGGFDVGWAEAVFTRSLYITGIAAIRVIIDLTFPFLVQSTLEFAYVFT
jgi:hypothetical protein